MVAVSFELHTAVAARQAALAPLLLGAAFGLLAFALRSATAPAAAMGAVLCLALTGPGASARNLIHSPGLIALVTLFVLTTAATRFGRAAKQRRGLAEPRHGRRISQILANLGAAAIFAATGHLLGALCALAEATADTLSSEIGQAIGGPTFLLTTARRVTPGTDGALSLAGTLAGLLGALAVAAAGAAALGSTSLLLPVFFAAVAGLLFDSLLGATLERHGLLGNDLVNLLSTVAAASAGFLFV